MNDNKQKIEWTRVNNDVNGNPYEVALKRAKMIVSELNTIGTTGLLLSVN